MKVIGKEKKPMYCDETLVDYYTIYIVDKLPKEEQYIDVDNKKGYVVSIQEDEETESNVVYLEKNLGDWNNQLAEICDVVYLKENY